MDIGFSGGTAQQRRWVEDAIASCSYDLSLIAATVNVQWADPLPVSADVGHAHSYMVTQSQGSQQFLISIATWADDSNHAENQGLPDPAGDIHEFYKQSFVHELGHVVHFSTITTDTERTAAAAYFWTPEVTGNSGRRYGTLADWSATVWGNNMKEAIAEVFKCACYTGRLIFANRTIWHIDKGAPWDGLWTFMLPPLKPLWKSAFVDYLDHAAGTASFDVPGQFGVKYLVGATAYVDVGPVSQDPIDPCANPGGSMTLDLTLSWLSGGVLHGLGSIQLDGGFTNAGLGCLPPGGDWKPTSKILIGFGTALPTTFSLDPGAQQLRINATPGDNPGDVVVACSCAAGSLTQTLTGVHGDAVLLAHYDLDTSGLISPISSPLVWSVASTVTVPDFPFASSDGVIAPGAAARGLIRVGR